MIPDRYVRKADGEPVEAMTWRGDNLPELRAFGAGAAADPSVVDLFVDPSLLCVGDRVVRDEDGRLAVVRAWEFWALYRGGVSRGRGLRRPDGAYPHVRSALRGPTTRPRR